INNLVLRDPALMAAWEKTRPPELATARTLLEQLVTPVRSRLQQRRDSGDTKVTDAQLRDALSEDDRKLFDALKKKSKRLDADLVDRKPHTWAYFSPATSPHLIETLPPRGQYPFPYHPAALKTNQAFVFTRGDPHQPGSKVTLGLPAVLDPKATNFTSRT